MKKKILIVVAALIIVVICAATIFLIKLNTIKNESVANLETMMMSSTKNEDKSEFDEWLLNELGVKYVPSYIVIDGYDVIGIIDGGFGVKDFTNHYNTIIKNHEILANLKEIKNTEVYLPFKEKTINLTDYLKTGKISIIEVHKISCNDCKIIDGVIGEYEIYEEFDEKGYPIEDSLTILKIDGSKVCETIQVHNTIKDVTFYRYYIKSDLKEILERYE